MWYLEHSRSREGEAPGLDCLSLIYPRRFSPVSSRYVGLSCVPCNLFQEDVLHCLRDCSYQDLMWGSIDFNDQEFFADQNVVSWFKLGITWTTFHLFLVAVWWLWRVRNEAVIAKEDLSHHFFHREILSLASLIRLCGHVNSNIASTSRTITWNTSKEATTILNVKAIWSNLGPLVFGGLLFNEEGSWLHGFYGNIGVH